MDLITVLESITMLSIVKALIVILLAVYTLFAFLMMKQISAMTRAVSMRDDYLIRILGVIHFIFALFVMVIAVTLI